MRDSTSTDALSGGRTGALGPVELAARVRARTTSAREAVAAALARIDAHDGAIAAFVAVDGDRALAEAAAIDERIAAGRPAGPLAGVPIGVKDLEDAIGFRTTRGSLLHADDRPARRDSILVARLRAAGCVVVGKTNTPEGGWTAATFNRVFPPTRNPWALDRTPGGSSGGSAAAVAAGLVPLATASDGGGSIRIPAALCGLTALKPSLGRVAAGGPKPPTWGDCTSGGVLTRRIRDGAAALESIVGPDPSDLRSLPMPTEPWAHSLDDLGTPRRVAWSPDLGYAEVDAAVLAACEHAVGVLADLGTEVVEVPALFAEDPVMTWLAITASYDWEQVADLEGTPDWDRLEPGRLAGATWAGRSVDARRLVQAERACHDLNLRLVEVLHGHTVLLTPTVAGRAPRITGGTRGEVNGVERDDWVRLTYPFNLTRSPAGTLRSGLDPDGLPVGLQVIGPQHGDVAVLRTLALLEDALAAYDYPHLQ
ncbi:MAG: amidase [Acidimicrobiia bacterium]|jgi:Asp-tRNA(Asn)/Glu-tRNA(Gln) amidotransferase A subunit family amidase|nr:amidase [Acidimicrobiia bacterium]